MPHPRSKRMLSVYPNPYVFDHEGRLSGVVRFDPDHGRRGTVHFVGAEVCLGIAKPSDKAGWAAGGSKPTPADRPLGGGRHTRFDVTYTFKMWPHGVPHTDYFVQQIKEGGLVAADEFTAKVAGQSFIPPKDRLAELKARAVARFIAEYGEPPDEQGWPDVTPYASQDEALAKAAQTSKAEGAEPAADTTSPAAPTPLIVPSTPSPAAQAEGDAS